MENENEKKRVYFFMPADLWVKYREIVKARGLSPKFMLLKMMVEEMEEVVK